MRRAALILALMLAPLLAGADGFRKLAGHGGPIMGLAVGPGGVVASASFDNAVGLWRPGAPPVWLDGHEAAVNAVAFVGDGLAASGGDDQRAIIWDTETGEARALLEGHEGKVMNVAASPDGRLLATAGWDWRIGLWRVEDGSLVRWLEGHTGPVNDIAFTGDGRLFSAAYDGTIREWRAADGVQTRVLARHGFGVNVLTLAPDLTWLAYGALDGGTRALSLADGAELADLTLGRRPILSLAQRADGGRIAVGDGEGYIMVVDTADWSIAHDFRAAARGPIWALAFVDDGAAVAAGGIADEAHVWPLSAPGTGEALAEEARPFHTDPDAVDNGERQFLRKCSVCHSLTPDRARKAGPTLHGVFGRRAGAMPGYIYSEALTDSDVIWSDATIDRLFEIGPAHFAPGTKMPMQQIARPEDRADLIAYLRAATRPDD